MKYIVSLLVAFPALAFASELPLSNYIKMQESLAADNMKGALEAHKVICDKEITSYKKVYKDCGKSFKDIADLRESFKVLSKVYIDHASKKELESYMKATCPMAGANWIQKNGPITNPYYGASMLKCGEKI
ncbi:MAG: hypothetical protein WCY48_06120 [Candidatus Caldatribacteriota bacterium]